MSYIEERNKESKQVVIRGCIDCMVYFEDGADWCLQSSVVRGLVKELQELYISVYGEPVASCAISNYEAALREIGQAP